MMICRQNAEYLNAGTKIGYCFIYSSDSKKKSSMLLGSR